jgi:Tol biopolymer transport system component
MALTPGRKLGPYEILAPLGAGGMGEVYRARDTRLDRDVAIKVLPTSLSRDPAIGARFEREAKTVSSLNHPHICVLHDIGHEGEIAFLVMELIEGETLAERIAKGPLATNEVLKIGGQIADALDRAHGAGVVHRDLKPANVMLTRSGAKLMDFGLARAASTAGATESSDGPTSQTPTVAQPLTAEGAIVGTFQYMAPEQLEGKEADSRADLWALGCVLFEMATGKRAFEGQSQASLIGSIMHVEPQQVSALAPLSPPELDRLVAACLTKNPADRVQSAHDVKLQLNWLAGGASSTSAVTAAAPAPQPAASKRFPVLALAAVALASAALTVLVMLFGPFRGSQAPPDSVPQRYVLASADLQPASTPVLSPDGASVVVSVLEGNSRRLYRRDFSSFQMTPISGTEDGQAPFFSPDGAWIGFVTSDAVKRVPIDGGVAQVIAMTSQASAGEWAEDGTIYLTHRSGGADGTTALSRVPETGGEIEKVLALDPDSGEQESWLPELLPDGETVLVSIIGGSGGEKIVAVRDDGSRHTAVAGGFLGRYVEPGFLLYVDSNSQALVVVPFDPASARSKGPAIPLTEEVDGSFCFDVAADGNLVYVPMPGAGDGDEIVWLDRKGATSKALERRSSWMQPRVSPDGRRILLRKTGTNCELWMLDVERGSLARVVNEGDTHDAIWAPDGKRILYHDTANGTLVAQTVGGMRKVETIAQGTEVGTPGSWTASGNLLAYTSRGQSTRDDIWIRVMDGSTPAEPFLATEFNERRPAFSPNGKWIAYTSDETGSVEVFVRSYPDAGAVWQISTSGGREPFWSRDGRELFFASGRKLMAVRVETGAGFEAGRPEGLFEAYLGNLRVRDFDVAPDGRFVSVHRPGGEAGQQELRMLTSWQREMQKTTRGRH